MILQESIENIGFNSVFLFLA